jgi:hypothetical protein
MKGVSIALAVAAVGVIGCGSPTGTTPRASALRANAQGNGPVLHRVTVGSPDAASPGTDGNFSLHAIQYADGSASGQWQDAFGRDYAQGPAGTAVGVHVNVNCVVVVGNQAWISGVATDKAFAGAPVATRVVAGANLISYSNIGDPTPCTAMENLPLLPLAHGNVTVQ